MKKCFLSVLVCICMGIIVLLSPGCTSNQATLSPTDDLIVYIPPYDKAMFIYDSLLTIVGTFRHKYPDVKVTIRDFNDDQNPEEAYKIYLETLKTELAAGKGPDLVCVETSDFDDLEKTMDSGVFYDLNKVIAQDTSFDKENYIHSLMEACQRGDKLLLVPVEYLSTVFITTQEVLDETGFQLTDGMSLEAFLTSLEQYYTRADTRQPLDDFTPCRLFFFTILENSGIPILDYKSKSATLDTVPFRQLAQTCKVIYDREQAVPPAGRKVSPYSAEFFLNGGALFTRHVCGSGISMVCLDIAMAGQNPIIFPIPSWDDSSTQGMLSPIILAGIPQGSPNKLNAYNLLKILLDKEIQDPRINSYHLDPMCLDILPDALDYISNYQKNDLYYKGKGSSADPEQIEAVRTDIVEQLQALYTNAPATLGISNAVRGILWEEMEPYFQGSCSLDDAIASAQEKLELYIAE